MKENSNDLIVREQLVSFLIERNAHLNMKDVIEGFPLQMINEKIPSLDHSAWDLLEHIRITQLDILDFIENEDYAMPKWPEDYWPQSKGSPEKWKQSYSEFKTDLNALVEKVLDPEVDLFQTMPAGKKYTIFREILLVIDHNSHHLGQIILLKKYFTKH